MPYYFSELLYQIIFSRVCFSISLTILGVNRCLTVSHSDEHYLVSHCVLICISDVENMRTFSYVYWLCMSSGNCPFIYFPVFFNVLFCHFPLICSITNIFVYFGYQLIIVMCIANFFSQSVFFILSSSLFYMVAVL